MAGDLHFYGRTAVAFYTQTKTVVSRWDYDEGEAKRSVAMSFEKR
jgi:malonate-semialdehyde dehydrogenase (acetylating) / methylmalonate-semialdehyde dehydrogenase